jgi:hypothetical protein
MGLMMRIEHTDDATLPIPEAVRALVDMLQTSGTVSGDRIYFPERRTRELLGVVRAALTAAQQQGEAAAVEVDLLPLPEGESSSFGNYEVHDNETMIEYARANVAHATAPLQAEIEALRAEVERLRADRGSREQKMANPAITHCDNCGCDWLDNGLNPVGCPYCKQSAWR